MAFRDPRPQEVILWLDQLRVERMAEDDWEHFWCRTYCVGNYAMISEEARAAIRQRNPWFLG